MACRQWLEALILLGGQKHLSKIHSDSLDTFLLNAIPIPFADSVKNLGVIMDKSVSGDLLVKQTFRNAFALIGGLWLRLNAKRALVDALVLPLLDYGAILHLGLSAINKRKMQRVQNCCMRFMHGLGRRESIGHLYVENNYLLLSVRRQWLMLVLFYKAVVKDGGPEYIAEEFKH